VAAWTNRGKDYNQRNLVRKCPRKLLFFQNFGNYPIEVLPYWGVAARQKGVGA
jgi:hypothetical protein